MAGDPKNTAIWDGADVYINFSSGAAGPEDTSTPWGLGWEAAGLLDGEAGFVEGREEESGEHYAWGGILHKRTRSQHKRTVAFTALEDNEVTFRLVNPGSERSAEGGLIKSTIKIPTTEQFSIGLETRAGSRVKRRWAKVAEVQEVGEITENETDPTVYEITVVLFPEEDKTLWHIVEDDPHGVPND